MAGVQARYRLAIAPDQSVDVIALDELRPGVFQPVLKEGVVLYEAKQE